MKRNCTSFVVIFEKTTFEKIVVGPFRSFKKAEGIARNAHPHKIGYVEPCVKPDDFDEKYWSKSE